MQQTALPVTRMERQNVITTNATLSSSSTAFTRIVLVREVTCGKSIHSMPCVTLLKLTHVEVDIVTAILYYSNHITMLKKLALLRLLNNVYIDIGMFMPQKFHLK